MRKKILSKNIATIVLVTSSQLAVAAQLEKVVVTAQKIEEGLQDVPIAVQTFSADGDFELFFGTEETSPNPGSLGVVDVRIGGGVDDMNYGAFVYIVMPSENQVRRFISSEHYIELNKEPPPPQ